MRAVGAWVGMIGRPSHEADARQLMSGESAVSPLHFRRDGGFRNMGCDQVRLQHATAQNHLFTSYRVRRSRDQGEASAAQSAMDGQAAGKLIDV